MAAVLYTANEVSDSISQWGSPNRFQINIANALSIYLSTASNVLGDRSAAPGRPGGAAADARPKNDNKPKRITKGALRYIMESINKEEKVRQFDNELESRFTGFLESLEPHIRRGYISKEVIEKAHKARPCPKPWC